MNVKRILKKYLIHPLKRNLFRSNFSSKEYWDARYVKGGNSGAGSYGRLAEFKSNIINAFVAENHINSIIEFGCGDGHQLALYKFNEYVGLDVSQRIIDLCKDKFKNDSTKSFFLLDQYNASHKCELALSIDVIFHLVEDDVFDQYMRRLFEASDKYVCIYSSNENHRNTALHVLHRAFTDWIAEKEPEWKLIKKVQNQYPAKIGFEDNDSSFADFYFYKKSSA